MNLDQQRFAAFTISQTEYQPSQYLVRGYFSEAEMFRVLLGLFQKDGRPDAPDVCEVVARAQTLEGARAVLPEGWHVVEGVYAGVEGWAP